MLKVLDSTKDQAKDTLLVLGKLFFVDGGAAMSGAAMSGPGPRGTG